MMNDLNVIRRLGALQIGNVEQARERAIGGVVAILQASRENRPSRRNASWTRAFGIVGVAIIAATCFSLFTSPGEAITSWVGRGLGFGQPGEHPSLQRLRHAWSRGTSAEGQPAHVLAVGPAPGGRYEFITYRPHETKGHRHGGRWSLNEPCFEVDLPQARSSYGGGCGVLPEGPDLSLGFGGNTAPGHELLFFNGQTSMTVASVEARLNGTHIPVELTTVPAQFVDRFRLEQQFRFFIGFLPKPLHGGKIVLVARDSAGKSLTRRAIRCRRLVLSPLGRRLRGRTQPQLLMSCTGP